MHSDIHCEDYFDPNNQQQPETISELDLSEGKRHKKNYAWVIAAAVVMIFLSSYDTCKKINDKNQSHLTEKK